MARILPTRTLIAVGSVNAVETFDFVIFLYLTTYLAATFFPSSAPATAILATLAVFAAGFIARPLGAYFIGDYADRAGRRPALFLTMALMTAATMAIAVTPSYTAIGIAAPIFICLARLVQGFAIGGEAGSMTALLVELAPPGWRALYVSWLFVGHAVAGTIAGMAILALITGYGTDFLADGGWRWLFAMSAVMLPIALYLRARLPETQQSPSAAEPPPSVPARMYVYSTLVIFGGAVATYATMYTVTFGIAIVKLPQTVVYQAVISASMAAMLTAVLAGLAADYFGRKWPAVIGFAGIAIVAPLFFGALAANPSASVLIIGSMLMAALIAMASTAGMTAIAEAFPQRRRGTGVGLVYALGVATLGGSTPFILAALIKATGQAVVAGAYVSLMAGVATFAMIRLGRDRAAAQSCGESRSGGVVAGGQPAGPPAGPLGA